MRKAKIERKTKETDIVLEINLDGKSEIEISTGIEFFDHMLCAFGTHAGFDLKMTATTRWKTSESCSAKP